MPIRLKLFAALLGFAGAGFAGFAQAQTVTVPATTIIAARQTAFALSAGTFAGMKAAIQHKDHVKPWAEAAGELEEWAGLIPAMFPDGTQTGHDTKAKPEIWSDRAGFEKRAKAYAQAAMSLEAAARADDTAAFTAAFKSVGQACGACHKSYRAKE